MEGNVLEWTVKAQYWQHLMVDEFTAELRRRMAFAFDQWIKRARYPDRLDQTELGKRVATAIQREESYTQSAVAGWLLGKIPREPIAALALAEELGLEPGWLYFSKGDAPDGWKEARAEMIAREKAAKQSGKVVSDGSGDRKPIPKRRKARETSDEMVKRGRAKAVKDA